MRKEPITIYGDGTQGRCWVFVTDLAQGHCLAMKQAAVNQILNLAGNEFVTVAQMVNVLSKTFGPLPIRYEPQRLGDFAGVRTSIEKARSLIGWSPATSLADGLSRYMECVRFT